jgi:hypothetical protein
MNPNNKSWQQEASEFIQWKTNPMADIHYGGRKDFDMVNLTNLTTEDFQLLKQVQTL